MQSQPLHGFFSRIHAAYFFQIVKEQTSRPHARTQDRKPRQRRSVFCPLIGGGERDRTDDLLLAKQALSQLSYTPLRRQRGAQPRHHRDAAPVPACPEFRPLMVGLVGFEPTTPRLSSVCSDQLSYRPRVSEHSRQHTVACSVPRSAVFRSQQPIGCGRLVRGGRATQAQRGAVPSKH